MKGTEFKSIRKNLNLSQPQLAVILDLSLRTIVNLEKLDEVKNHYAYALQFIRYQDHLKKIGDLSNEIVIGKAN